MVRKKSKPVRNLRNNTLQILTERVESLERERVREEEEINTTICLAVPRRRDLGQRSAQDQEEDMSVKSAIKNFRQSVIWKITRVHIRARSRSNAEFVIKRLIDKTI
jgi:hypothetical protein